MRALLGSRTAESGLCCCDLDVTLTRVGEKLWRANDQVNEWAEKRNQRANGRATDEEPVFDPTTSVEKRPRNERKPDDCNADN
jgi:hypothetical protein